MGLHGVETFSCYYGVGQLEHLARYGVAVVQPGHFSAVSVQTLHTAGCKPLAYLSIGEEPETGSLAEWVMIDPHTGQPAQNPHWQTYYVDCRVAVWQRKILQQEIPAILQRGFRGLFLDTLDVQERFPQTRPGVVQLVRLIRAMYPQVWLVANRGFSILPQLLPLLDGVMFEAMSSRYENGRYLPWSGRDLQWIDTQATWLQTYSNGRALFALDYADPADTSLRQLAQERAARFQFLSFVTTWSLDWLPVSPPL